MEDGHEKVTFDIDGSARIGQASTEFDGRYADANAKYDADGLYGSIHVGAGYVFALSGKTDLDLYGRCVLTYLEGDTGIVEVGITVRPSGASPWSADIGIKGCAGDRRGVSVNASVLYAF